MTIEQKFVTALREHGMKITPQRRFIFQALERDMHLHPTAEDIFTDVRQTLPDISLTTVYNTLRELVAMGLLRQVDLGEGMTRFDPNTDLHHHLLCTHCGRLEDVYVRFPCIALPDDQSRGFTVTNHQVIFEGLCPDCQI